MAVFLKITHLLILGLKDVKVKDLISLDSLINYCIVSHNLT